MCVFFLGGVPGKCQLHSVQLQSVKWSEGPFGAAMFVDIIDCLDVFIINWVGNVRNKPCLLHFKIFQRLQDCNIH